MLIPHTEIALDIHIGDSLRLFAYSEAGHGGFAHAGEADDSEDDCSKQDCGFFVHILYGKVILLFGYIGDEREKLANLILVGFLI